MAEAARLAAWQIVEIGRELRVARIASGRRQVDVARGVGTSGAQVSRIERGHVKSVSHRLLALLAASSGLKLSLKAFPAGRRLLDKPQLELLAALRARAHASWQWRTEVPMPIGGDLRAGDAVATKPNCSVLAELLTRLSDYQGQTRPALLKQRDLGADRLILVLWGTAANRRALREAGDAVKTRRSH